MHAWNSSFVQENWDRQSTGHLLKLDGKTSLQDTRVAAAYRKLMAEATSPEVEDPRAVLAKAKEQVRAGFMHSPFPFESAARGFFMMTMSELGRRDDLNDLLEFSDRKLAPSWERGGLFYPRNDEREDAEGDFVHVEPHSGNSAIGYSRLNVENGQKIMWEKPWTREYLKSRPAVEGCSLKDDVDFLRGEWDEEREALIVTVKAWEQYLAKPKQVGMAVRGLAAGQWAVYVNGELQKTHEVKVDGAVEVGFAVNASEEVDVVVWKVVV